VKRAMAVLLLCGCAYFRTGRAMEMQAPPWAAEQSIYVDPNTEHPLIGGGFVDDVARDTAERLAGAGFRAGAPTEPDTVVVRIAFERHLLAGFTLHALLRRGDAAIEDIALDSADSACLGTDARCWSRELSSRIAASQKLASLHTAQTKEAGASTIVHLSGRLAVLELRNSTSELTARQARYFTDLVRSGALQRAPQLEVITRENLLVLLQASGKDLANCEGECEVDTGRRIGADAIVSGEIQKIGKNYKIALRLHETHEGRLIAAAVASGESVETLDDETGKATAELFRSVRP